MSLQLDTTGLASANRIEGEVIAVTPASLSTFGCVFLAKGPFFGKNFALSYLPSSPSGASARALVLGVDYNFMFELPGFGATPQDKVWGAISLLNEGLNGTLSVGYQSLGGNWTFDLQSIKNYLNTTQFNSNIQFMALMSRDPLYLPNNPNAIWPLNSIQSVTIAQAQLSNIILSIEFQRIDGTAIAASQVYAEELPLPTNAAKEEGGKLAIIASAMGHNADGVNMPTGGVGLLGWLSGLFNLFAAVRNSVVAIANSLVTQVPVSQQGNWVVQLRTGTNMIGSVVPVAFTEIVDYITSVGFVYICEAVPGSAATQAVWRIQKMDLSTGSVVWAAGGNFDQIATARDSLSYS